jgi:hypothetical protein
MVNTRRFRTVVAASSVAAFLALLAAPAGAATGFRVVTTPNPSTSGNDLADVAAISSTDAWAVGSYEGDNTVPSKTLAEHWNGTAWSVVSTPNPGSSSSCGGNNGNELEAVSASSSSDVWAVGSYYSCTLPETLAEHWNGTAWSVVPTPSPGTNNYNQLYDVVALSPTDAWAVGYYYPGIGEAARTLVEHWNGSAWSVVKSPNLGTTSTLTAITAVSSTELWAVGYTYSQSADRTTMLVLHYAGGVWTASRVPRFTSGDQVLLGVTAVSGNDVWAVGDQEVYPNPQQTLAIHWNGTAWTVVPSPNRATDSGSEDYLLDVAANSSTDVYAVGWYASEATDHFQHRTMIQHWDGTSWTVTTSPSPGESADLNGVATLPSGSVWTSGLYSTYGYDIYDRYYILPKTLVLAK